MPAPKKGADRVLCLLARRLDPADRGDVATDDPAATTTLQLGRLDAEAVCELARRLRTGDLSTAAAEHHRSQQRSPPPGYPPSSVTQRTGTISNPECPDRLRRF